jgi:hypothetical protein
VILLR